jgi:hypothetical protein
MTTLRRLWTWLRTCPGCGCVSDGRHLDRNLLPKAGP